MSRGRAAGLTVAASALVVLAAGACTGDAVPDPGPTSSAPTTVAPAPQDPAPTVMSLTRTSTGTQSLVARPGWQALAADGSCVLSWRGAGDVEPPTTTAREASEVLLAATRDAEGGEPLGATRDVLLPLTSDGVTIQGTNGVAQEWSVATPRGAVQVRGVARVAVGTSYEGHPTARSLVVALDCAGPFDEGAWNRVLANVRVEVLAPVEELGVWSP